MKSYQAGISAVRWLVSPRNDVDPVLQYGLSPIHGGALDWFDVSTEVAATHPLAAAVPQQEAGEPVARVALIFAQRNGWDGADGAPKWLVELVLDVADALATPQVSPPQARVPLTVDQVLALAAEADLARDYNNDGDVQSTRREDADITEEVVAFARAIERAHLIGLETKGDGNG